jgi:hypothetical protein
MLSPSPEPLLSIADPTVALALLERALAAEKRGDEALVVSELRAAAGELDERGRASLRVRRTAAVETAQPVLDRATLASHVLSAEGRSVLVDVALAVAGIEGKVLRVDLEEIGLSNRERISPRSGHPLRRTLDRIARSMAVDDIDLAIAPAATRTRVISQDPPCIVLPASMADQPEPAQLANLARAVARVALGVPWLQELSPPHMQGLLVAAARHVVPTFAAEELDAATSALVAKYTPSVGRALSRRHRRSLEEIAPRLASAKGRLPATADFVDTMTRAELRAAFLVGGDLLALLGTMGQGDASLLATPGPQALSALLRHPHAGDVVRFALTREATALRRRLGSTWTSPAAPL